MRDKCEVFTKNAKLDWIVSENWNQHEISQRGKMSDLLLRKEYCSLEQVALRHQSQKYL